ncbi:PIR protein [Plasmodium ovale]|uniref:PIR protein n=1 Tax=Plasmodium ovale TaxID=36330 RepID=A0A1C3KHN0_PLAOA|nr:PIR protein [Plasmodium ovale]
MAKPESLKELNYYKIFFKVRHEFNTVVDGKYDEFLYKEDQVLLNIALYLLENYNGDYVFYCGTSSDECKDRCNFLNTWLNEKKSLYTSNGKCTHHNALWEQYIEGLWNKLASDEEQGKKCNRVLSTKVFPSKWIFSSCNNSNPVKIQPSCPDTPVCAIGDPRVVSLHSQEHSCPPANCPTSSCKAVLTTTYIVFGILLFAMYLLRFSSVGMKINNLIRGRKLKGRNVDNETDESFRNNDNYNMESLDGRFHVIYNSLQNS